MTEQPHSIVSAEERARKIREESARIEAEQAEQERRQRDRQIAHGREALKLEEEHIATMTALITDKDTRETIHARILRMREEAKAVPEQHPVPIYTERQRRELEEEQAAGRRTLEKHAEQTRIAQAARARVSAEERTKEEEAERKPSGYTTPVHTDNNFVPGFKV